MLVQNTFLDPYRVFPALNHKLNGTFIQGLSVIPFHRKPRRSDDVQSMRFVQVPQTLILSCLAMQQGMSLIGAAPTLKADQGQVTWVMLFSGG